MEMIWEDRENRIWERRENEPRIEESGWEERILRGIQVWDDGGKTSKSPQAKD